MSKFMWVPAIVLLSRPGHDALTIGKSPVRFRGRKASATGKVAYPLGIMAISLMIPFRSGDIRLVHQPVAAHRIDHLPALPDQFGREIHPRHNLARFVLAGIEHIQRHLIPCIKIDRPGVMQHVRNPLNVFDGVCGASCKQKIY